MVLGEVLLKDPAEDVWIPEKFSDLQLRLWIISHTSPVVIAGQFRQNPRYEKTLLVHTKYRHLDIRPLLYPLSVDDSYWLTTWLVFPDTSAENAVRAIIYWNASLGDPNGLMSDVSTHFENVTVCLVLEGFKVPHYFTLPYTTWSDEAVERFGKELL